jgi:hypothetical protein
MGKIAVTHVFAVARTGSFALRQVGDLQSRGVDVVAVFETAYNYRATLTREGGAHGPQEHDPQATNPRSYFVAAKTDGGLLA